MFKVTENGNQIQSYKVAITADSRNDVQDIPTTYEMGSTCFVIEDSSVWMLGGDKQWHEV